MRARLERAVAWLATFLSTTTGFLVVFSTVMLGLLVMYLFGFNEIVSLAVNLYLSIAAIIISGVILLQNDKDVAAIHAKLDEVLIRLPGSNELVGLEHQLQEEIATKRAEVEKKA